ncbi:hypothetical protein Dimus_028065 [Dionaea muscipula]
MIKTLNPYSTSSSKTDEIMSRYRPIAPKPETPAANGGGDGGSVAADDPMLSPKMRRSPYLRSIWTNLQARPTRTRKRGRTGVVSPLAIKRQRTTPPFVGFCSPSPLTTPAQSLTMQMQGFAHRGLPLTAGGTAVLERPMAAAASIGTRPLLSCPMPSPTVTQLPLTELNLVNTFDGEKASIKGVAGGGLDEKDLQLELKVPSITGVLLPQPIRPIGSSIRVGFISTEEQLLLLLHAELAKERQRAEEVEEAMESEELPAIISDSNNKVRMTNSAYKEMVGQPECPWLDSMLSSGGCCGRRISGEVVIHDATETGLPISSAKRFSCWVRIEWERKGEKRWIDAFSEVMRLRCDSKDYLFTWKFHVQERERERERTGSIGVGILHSKLINEEVTGV